MMNTFIISLALFCVISMSTAHAGTYSGGTGTEEDPYQIATKADLLELGSTTSDYSKHFVMKADIDLAGETFNRAIIAYDPNDQYSSFYGTKFTGIYDGNNHTIDNLTISYANKRHYIGLFGYIYNATIRNLKINNVSNSVGSTSYYIGGLTAYSDSSIISNCYVTGYINGADYAGCIAGRAYSSTINRSSASGEVSGAKYVGGFIGEHYDGALIEDLSTGSVTCSSYYSGGFAGKLNYVGTCRDCFAQGDITTVDANYSGGFVGYSYYSTVNNCYSIGKISSTTVKGFCGYKYYGAVNDSYWDTEASGQTSSPAGIGKITDEMQLQETFSGWDFTNTWVMDGYPMLICHIPPELTSIVIEGPNQVNERSSAVYTCLAAFSDFTTNDVTDLTIWSLDLQDIVTLNSNILNVGILAGNTNCNLTAVHEGKTNTFAVSLIEAFPNVVSLEIVGSDQVNENSVSNFSCIATYDNAMTSNITELAEWDVDNTELASLTAGELSTGSTLTNTTIEISTSFEGVNTNKTVIVVDCMLNLVSIEIIGPAEMNENSTSNYICMANYNNGSSSNVTSYALWYEYSSNASVDQNGVVTAGNIYYDQLFSLFCEFSDGYNAESDSLNITIKTVITTGIYSGGSGTQGAPYEISTKQDLIDLANNEGDYNKSFIMTADIDLANTNFPQALIAPDIYNSSTAFNGFTFGGTFDGNNHTISNMTINALSGAHICYIGLFGQLESTAVIKNLNIINFSINVASTYDAYYLGGICAYNSSGIISNCFASGSIICNWADNFTDIGAICGWNNNGIISNCRADINITGSGLIGGICGRCWGGKISQSSATGQLSGNSSCGGICGSIYAGTIDQCVSKCQLNNASAYDIGGVCGSSSYGTIQNSYFSGSVTGYSSVGGLCAHAVEGSIKNCYSSGSVAGTLNTGGFSGYCNNVTINNCFWDSESSGQSTSAAGISKTTAEMQTRETFNSAGWDFSGESINGTDDIWIMDRYPVLACHYTFTHVVDWAIEQGIPAGQQSIYDDPADDNIPNLIKYASGLIATNAATTLDIMNIYEEGVGGLSLLGIKPLELPPENGFAIVYYKSKTATGVVLEPIWSTNLVEEVWFDTGMAIEYLDDIGDRERWKATLPSDIPSAYIRLRAREE